MKTIETHVRGLGVVALESGDSVTVTEGVVYLSVWESDAPHFTITTPTEGATSEDDQ